VLRGSSTGAGGRKLAGYGLVDGGVRGIYFVLVEEGCVGYTSVVSLSVPFFAK
jgi:hypothetical protein